MTTVDSTAPTTTAPDLTAGIRTLAGETLERLGFGVAGTSNQQTEAVAAAFAGALAYHRSQFEKASKTADEGSVIEALAAGEFAYGRRKGCNLWEDVALAVLLAAGDHRAVDLFRDRFGERVSAWQHRYSSRDPFSVEDFIADLLLPREKAGPRIDTYQGHGPFDGWLKQVYISICHKRREKQASPITRLRLGGQTGPASDGLIRSSSDEDAPDERWARHECEEKLKPVIAECMDVLDGDHRQVLLMAVVDGVPQKKIAQLYGVPPHRITRMKQKAIKRIVEHFMDIARRTAEMAADSVRQCIELLLETFPAR